MLLKPVNGVITKNVADKTDNGIALTIHIEVQRAREHRIRMMNIVSIFRC